MITFIKAQSSSLLATLVDFVLTLALAELFGLWYAAANMMGIVGGGITNFIINRDWVFNGPQQGLRRQIVRYLIVWCGNVFLNTTGVYLATEHLALQYLISKIVVSLVVGWGYNYQLQKNFVFKKVDYVS